MNTHAKHNHVDLMSCNFVPTALMTDVIYYLKVNSIDLQFRFQNTEKKVRILGYLPVSSFVKTNIHCVCLVSFQKYFPSFLKDASKKLPKRYECCGSLATCQVQATRRVQLPVIQRIQICRSSKVQRQPV